MNKLTFTVFLVAATVSCGKSIDGQGNSKENISNIQVLLNTDTIYTGKNKDLQIKITLYPAASVEALVVRKGTSILRDYKTIEKKDMEKGKGDSLHYVFRDQVKSDWFEGKDTLHMAFSAINKDKKESGVKTLLIDNRTGLFATKVSLLARVTGADLSSGQTFTSINPNKTTSRYDVGCTDLGFMWTMGNGQIGVVFGDTQGKAFVPGGTGGPNGGNWRSNVLAFTSQKDTAGLENGLIFSGMLTEPGNPENAREFIHSPHITNGSGSYTAIPTSAVHAGGKDFIHYMDIRSWGTDGKWITNFSGLSMSSDNGQNWQDCPEIRFTAESNFAQVGFDNRSGFVYMMGTPSGRVGAAYLARIPENSLLDQGRYEFWNSEEGWLMGKNGEAMASPIIPAPVSELSIHFSSRFNRWLLTYLDPSRHAIVIKQAKEIIGPWSAPQDLVSSTANNNYYGGMYGGCMYPLETSGNSLYFTLSIWFPYNVFWMRADLKLVE